MKTQRAYVLGLLLTTLWMPQSSQAGCSGPTAVLPGPDKAAHDDTVKVLGYGFAEDLPCCDSGLEACEREKEQANVVPYRGISVGLKDKQSGAETIVARGIDAGMRGRFRATFRIPNRVDPGVYRVRINVPNQRTYGAGRLLIRPDVER